MSRRANLKLVAVDGDLVAGTEVPAVLPVEYRAANDAMSAVPGWGPEAEDAPAAAETGTTPQRWSSLTAIALSLTAHAALLAGAATFLTRAGSEAEIDSVAVEIIFEAPPSLPAEPATTEVVEAEDEARPIADAPVETDEFVPPTDATSKALLADAPVVEAAETVEPVAEEPAAPTLAEAAEIALPTNAATEALLAEPPVIEPAVPEAAETIAEVAAVSVPVEAAEIAPPKNAATEALLAEPPVIEPEAREAIQPVKTETIELPALDPTLAVLAVPPTIEVTPEAAPDPVAAPLEAADTTQLPDTVAMTPSPRPQAEPPAANTKPVPLVQANDPAPRKTAEAPNTKAKKSKPPKEAERVAEAKPAPATKKVAAAPPTKSRSAAGAAASAGASAGVEAAYGRKLLAHVERRKRYPAAARAAKVTGAVRLSITIDRNGQLRSVRVAKGSGHAVLDEEALATARRASPYPAPPDGVGGKTFAFAVTLRFSR